MERIRAFTGTREGIKLMNNRPVALVTGASSGLGHGLSVRLARAGYRIGLCARRQEALQEVAAEIAAMGGTALAIPCDVGSRAEVEAAVERCEEELGPIDLLLANAGVSGNTIPEDLRAEVVETVMRVNFLGAVYAVEAVLPGMLERNRGHIVGMGSLAGFGGLPISAAYSASKGALHNFLESLRIDLRDTGVDVTLICPGYVRSPMTDQNAFPMPFLVEPEPAVEKMFRAIVRRKKLLAFPFPLAALAWIARILPRALYDRIASGFQRKKRGVTEAPEA